MTHSRISVWIRIVAFLGLIAGYATSTRAEVLCTVCGQTQCDRAGDGQSGHTGDCTWLSAGNCTWGLGEDCSG
jgi:hypothetical protein